jgi:hypothetical protein
VGCSKKNELRAKILLNIYMHYIKLETQMRSGTHYLLDALVHVYHAKVMKLRKDQFCLVNRKVINEGLYESKKSNYLVDDNETFIFHHHYFHSLPADNRLKNSKSLILIGYPFDSFYSDGMVFSSGKYSVAPSQKNRRFEQYRLLWNSAEWKFLEKYMQKNSRWLRKIAKRNDVAIIRYEDFFLDFSNTINKIEKLLGSFKEKFPLPTKNNARIYWTDDYRSKMDRDAFEKLLKYFQKSVSFFYPEKHQLCYEK